MMYLSNFIKISYLGKRVVPVLYTVNINRIAIHRNMCQKAPNVAKSTVDENELEKFRSLATEWWKYNGDFQVLMAMNNLRVPLVRDILSTKDKAKPLEGFKIIDIGSGGGFFSEPLARLGAKVTGIDPVIENVNIATQHASLDPDVANNVTYVCQTVEEFAKTGEIFDTVVCSEVVEHVDNMCYFVQHCTKLVKNNGSLFFSTINRTFLSYVTAILSAEYIFRDIPMGTHQWQKFVKPSELKECLESFGCQTMLIHGMVFNPIARKWSWSNSTQVSYALHAVKTNIINNHQHS